MAYSKKSENEKARHALRFPWKHNERRCKTVARRSRKNGKQPIYIQYEDDGTKEWVDYSELEAVNGEKVEGSGI